MQSWSDAAVGKQQTIDERTAGADLRSGSEHAAAAEERTVGQVRPPTQRRHTSVGLGDGVVVDDRRAALPGKIDQSQAAVEVPRG